MGESTDKKCILQWVRKKKWWSDDEDGLMTMMMDWRSPLVCNISFPSKRFFAFFFLFFSFRFLFFSSDVGGVGLWLIPPPPLCISLCVEHNTTMAVGDLASWKLSRCDVLITKIILPCYYYYDDDDDYYWYDWLICCDIWIYCWCCGGGVENK